MSFVTGLTEHLFCLICLIFRYECFQVLNVFVLNWTNTVLPPCVRFPTIFPFVNITTGLNGLKEAVSLLSGLDNPGVTFA